ncbi:aminopeptidase [Virgibacillus necropolis]|uniref:Aminopeptidase n=1 Tax=Virgibacillus necropolis TaxID=163877 RepID=A0A221M9C0_9BACI|nr:aminopeptidase [Virgibacillus necropolis]ASN04243.1 aminopeptidase [Virgibacillus necropolis]
MRKLIQLAKSILNNNLQLNKMDQLLIVTDSELMNIAEYFYQAGVEMGNETLLTKMITRSKSGEEPPTVVGEAMKSSDVVLCITKHSLTHTKARKQASLSGARIATMPGITLDMLQEGAILANYKEVEKLTYEYCELLDKGEQVTIIKEHTSLSFSIKGRKGIPSTGVFYERGDSGNLPSGESYIAPIEESANGKIMIDGSISGIGILNEAIVLTIKNGRLIEASGAKGKHLLELLGEGKGRTIAELGIGTNRSARLTGNVLEDEKVAGTVHIAFGSNKSFGGKTEAGVHIDCVIKEPKLYIDGKEIRTG